MKKIPLLNRIKGLLSRQAYWKKIEYFDDTWENRIVQMAKFIPSGKSVMDLGCGKMFLKKYLKDNPYYPVDYIKRMEGCIICDFNKKQFPQLKVDISFISGCLEYILPYRWFISSACQKCNQVILSYCTTDKFPERDKRKSLAWVNHLSKNMIIKLFQKNGFSLTHYDLTPNNNSIFVFENHEKKPLYRSA